MKVMKTYHSSKEWPNHSNGLDITALCVMRNLKDKNATNLTLWFPNKKQGLKKKQARTKLIWTCNGFEPLCVGGWRISANWIYANNITLHPNSSLKICRSWAKFSQNCQNMCEFGWNSTDFSLFAEGCLYYVEKSENVWLHQCSLKMYYGSNVYYFESWWTIISSAELRCGAPGKGSRSDLLRESGWWGHRKHKNTLDMHFDAPDQVQRFFGIILTLLSTTFKTFDTGFFPRNFNFTYDKGNLYFKNHMYTSSPNLAA